MRGSLQERFEDKWIPEPNSGCWLWVGAVDRKGYGQMRVNGRARVATHIALELSGEAVPDGQFVCHKCDVPACVNPGHLFVSAALGNTRDMMQKGRQNFDGLAAGRKQKQEYSAKQFQARKFFEAGKLSNLAIARILDVAPGTVGNWKEKYGIARPVRPEHRTHCSFGHVFDAGNTGRDSRGHRYCRQCRNVRRNTR